MIIMSVRKINAADGRRDNSCPPSSERSADSVYTQCRPDIRRSDLPDSKPDTDRSRAERAEPPNTHNTSDYDTTDM